MKKKHKYAKILDCESIESTYKSLEAILGVKRDKLQQVFDSLDIYNAFYEEKKYNYFSSPDDLLLSYVKERTCCKTEFDEICGFHCTRTLHGNTFSEGLLPLSQSIGKIWDYLFMLVGNQLTIQQWTNLRDSISSSNNRFAYQYNLKFQDINAHGGPWAWLIKEAGLHNGAYLTIPEIIEDICGYCSDIFSNVNLKKLFIDNTVPCIIKFVTPTNAISATMKTHALSAAMKYVYDRHQDPEILGASGYGFSAGEIIPKDQILMVESPICRSNLLS
jgi:hypothetical protein